MNYKWPARLQLPGLQPPGALMAVPQWSKDTQRPAEGAVNRGGLGLSGRTAHPRPEQTTSPTEKEPSPTHAKTRSGDSIWVTNGTGGAKRLAGACICGSILGRIINCPRSLLREVSDDGTDSDRDLMSLTPAPRTADEVISSETCGNNGYYYGHDSTDRAYLSPELICG
ncbi:hypothetical protein NDU88_010787 [Pleurodeles waltl]|uniref:Uncharacterized protein n=1 Tax=Pleurodeles waltl TaxID=8319 RepID=A0AAV7S1T8_PLEWA|nr:hypothetical protein NDU88_010787 [Pleurodeles waltl]